MNLLKEDGLFLSALPIFPETCFISLCILWVFLFAGSEWFACVRRHHQQFLSFKRSEKILIPIIFRLSASECHPKKLQFSIKRKARLLLLDEVLYFSFPDLRMHHLMMFIAWNFPPTFLSFCKSSWSFAIKKE